MQSFPSPLYSVTFISVPLATANPKQHSLTSLLQSFTVLRTLISSLVYQDLFTCQIYIESVGLFFLSSVALLPPYIRLHYRPHRGCVINKQGIGTASSNRGLVTVCVSAHNSTYWKQCSAASENNSPSTLLNHTFLSLPAFLVTDNTSLFPVNKMLAP